MKKKHFKNLNAESLFLKSQGKIYTLYEYFVDCLGNSRKGKKN